MDRKSVKAAAEMNIKELTSDDYQKYNGLAALYGSVFDTLEWTQFFGKDIAHYGIYNAGDELIGGFYLYKSKAWGLSLYRNPPLTPSTGLFLKSENENPVRVMERTKRVLSLIAELIEKIDYSIISLSFTRNIIDMQPFLWRNFKVSPEYTYIMDLGLPVDAMWKRMSNERRRSITKGTKDGLIVKKIHDYEIVRSLVLKTFSRQHKKYNDYYMNRVLFEFANEDNSFAFATFNNDTPVACTFCVRDKKAAHALLAGYDSENKHRSAGAMCQWEAIQYAKELGLEYFDFEGSMVARIEQYVRGFGGSLTPYYRINKAILPIEILLKFRRRQFF